MRRPFTFRRPHLGFLSHLLKSLFQPLQPQGELSQFALQFQRDVMHLLEVVLKMRQRRFQRDEPISHVLRRHGTHLLESLGRCFPR
jgi:hypothetical protein